MRSVDTEHCLYLRIGFANALETGDVLPILYQ